MTTYDDSLLATRFAALAPEPLTGDWDEVLGRAGIARTGYQRPRGLQRRRRRFLVVLAVMALVVAVGTAAAFGVRALILDNGFIGLAPLGATPSTPESGELEIFYWVERGAPGEVKEGRSRNWVYADGRLISDRFSNGLVEQRLTPEGLELLRSEILSTGQFSLEPPRPRLGRLVRTASARARSSRRPRSAASPHSRCLSLASRSKLPSESRLRCAMSAVFPALIGRAICTASRNG